VSTRPIFMRWAYIVNCDMAMYVLCRPATGQSKQGVYSSHEEMDWFEKRRRLQTSGWYEACSVAVWQTADVGRDSCT